MQLLAENMSDWPLRLPGRVWSYFGLYGVALSVLMVPLVVVLVWTAWDAMRAVRARRWVVLAAGAIAGPVLLLAASMTQLHAWLLAAAWLVLIAAAGVWALSARRWLGLAVAGLIAAVILLTGLLGAMPWSVAAWSVAESLPTAGEAMAWMLSGLWALLALSLIAVALERRSPAPAALGLAMLVWAAAYANSDAIDEVRRLPSAAEVAAARAQQASLERQRTQALTAHVDTSVRFAEETDAEAMDLAGLDEERRAAIEELGGGGAGPQAAGERAYREGGLQAREAGKVDEARVRATTAAVTDEARGLARALPSEDWYRAQAWNDWLLGSARLLLLLTLGLVAAEYLVRFGRSFDRRYPLPIAGRWLEAVTDEPRAVWLDTRGGDEVVERYIERAGLKREGLLYFGERDRWPGREAMHRVSLWGWWGWRGWRLPLLRVTQEGTVPGGEFVFESAWFGRYGFLVLGEAASRRVLARVSEHLRMRTLPRASASRTVHVVWDFEGPPEPGVLEDLVYLCRLTRFTLVVASRAQPGEEMRAWFDELERGPSGAASRVEGSLI